MAVTYSSFVLKFPEFVTADVDEQARITGFIADAALEVNATAWGAKTDLGVSYLAAHRLALANRTKITGPDATAGSGAVIEAKSGKLSVKFSDFASGGVSDLVSLGLASTPYGVTYAEMRSTLSITPLTTA
jgi:hypothetical protein